MPLTDHFEIGHTRFQIPAGCTVKLSSAPDTRRSIDDFLTSSPDHTLYHFEPYFEHARREGFDCDLALVSFQGMPAFAIPLHLRPPVTVVTGYSGVVFPSGSERTFKRTTGLLRQFLDLNAHLSFEVLQSAQGSAYEDPSRVAAFMCGFDELDATSSRLYSRVLQLSSNDRPVVIGAENAVDVKSRVLDPNALENNLLSLYDADARNQVRQAMRSGLTIEVFSTTKPTGTREGYSLLHPLHIATWARSGISGHSLEYWLDLSSAIAMVPGAEDLVVVVRTARGAPVSGVTCHLYGTRAIYWSGCSSAEARESRANPLCLHAAISLCQGAGVRYFELGRFRADEPSAKERAVTQYKNQFGGVLTPVANFRRQPRRRGGAVLMVRRLPRRIVGKMHRTLMRP